LNETGAFQFVGHPDQIAAMKTDRPTPPRRRSPDFRGRYDDLERRRSELIERLARLDHLPQAADSCRRARTMLNATYRKATLVQRAAVLQAATWLVDVAEMMSSLL
jgi:hypothetical protein